LRCRCGQIIVVPGRGPEVRAARTLHCNNCGGELKKGQPECPFCGALVDLTHARLTAYCPSCLSMSKEGAKFCSGCGKPLTTTVDSPKETKEQCPRCQIRMRRRGVGEHNALECPVCCGLFVEVHVLDQMLRDQERRVGQASSATRGPERATLRSEPVSYVKCPICKTIMNRLNYGRISGVIVDYCREHGYWLDEDELEKIAKWIATGGLQQKYAREAEEAKAEALRRSTAASNASLRMSADDFGERRGFQGSLAGGLFELVIKLFDN
jgi:Zn-finger nucleic acid-binding protein